MIERIIYINLSRRCDKRNFMEAQLSKLDIPYERFDAIRPTKESLLIGKYKNFYERSSQGKRNSLHMRLDRNTKKARGEFGVYLSHYSIHKNAAENAWGNYLILEDDCLLGDRWLIRLSNHIKRNRVPTNWDMFRCCWKSERDVNKFNSCNRQSRFSTAKKSNHYSGGSHFQLCRGESASRILNYLDSDYVYNIDSAYSTDRINVYHAKIEVKVKGEFSSDISNDKP